MAAPELAFDPTSLAQLHEIVAPGPVPAWPPAPGWYAVAAIVVLVAAWLGLRAWRRYRANRYRRVALHELARLEAGAEGDTRRALVALAALLKRVALASHPRARVASLSGAAWADFLDETGRGGPLEPEARARLGALLHGGAGVAPPDSAELARTFRAAERWIRRHRALAEPT